MNVILVGSGAVAAELTSYIEDHNKNSAWEGLNVLGYLEFDENIEQYWAKYKLKMPVLSNVYDYTIQEDDHFIIAIANADFRKKMIGFLKSKNARIIGFIHHSSIIAHSATIGIGTIVYPHCIIGPNSKIGDNNFITSYSFISHDCKIGNNNFFSTAGLGGHVTIGNDNFFGIRATVVPNVSIGSNNTIQSGMVVDKNVEDNATVFYRFKEKVIAVPKNDQ